MATDLERLVVSLSADIRSYENAMRRAQGVTTRNVRQIEGAFARANRNIQAGFVGLAKGFAGAFTGGVAISAAQKLIDASVRISNALKVAGLSGDELTRVYDRLFESAQRNAAPLESLVTLYGRAATVQRELGVSTEELLTFTDNVSLALRVAGTDAQSASGALLQLSQALGSGTVRAEEFNSILEGALPIAQAAAAGLEEAGGSVAKLRALVIDGKVSSEAFFRAFEAGAVTLQTKVAGAETTVSQGFVRLTNVLIKVAGEFNQATGISNGTANALLNLAEAIESLGDFMVAAANGPVGRFIGRLGELNEIAKSALTTLARFSLVDEQIAALGSFIAPGVSEGVDPRIAGGKTGRIGIDPIQSRIDSAFGGGGVKTVSLSDFAAPTSTSGGAKKAKDTFDAARDGFADLIGYTESYREEQERVNASIDAMGDIATNAGTALANALADGKLEAQELIPILTDVINQLLSAAQAAGGFGSLFGNLFGGGFNPTAGGFASMLGFAKGGYTGPGGKHQPKGVVHGGEFVFSKAATQRAGVGNLAAMHSSLRGYANGGLVGPAPMLPRMGAANQNGGVVVEVNNYSSNTKTREERGKGPNGQELRRIIIEDVKSEFASGGFDKSMTARYGGQPVKTVR